MLTEGGMAFSPQGRGVGSTRKKPDTAALEDRDKPYACDSESSTEGLVGRGIGRGWVM